MHPWQHGVHQGFYWYTKPMLAFNECSHWRLYLFKRRLLFGERIQSIIEGIQDDYPHCNVPCMSFIDARLLEQVNESCFGLFLGFEPTGRHGDNGKVVILWFQRSLGYTRRCRCARFVEGDGIGRRSAQFADVLGCGRAGLPRARSRARNSLLLPPLPLCISGLFFFNLFLQFNKFGRQVPFGLLCNGVDIVRPIIRGILFPLSL